ncbi:putative peptide ABC transporter permease protein [Gordonia effusa NBRC 100432]|uniref:Putative peptide ABC transporter permease protein n=1 Tax=Gordonia effusa NBRC 100432 TaxID=1077974 RepID=H0QXL7_9ACTN|nr:ABC transporter permease [Gordonia effusa]GAB17568.1 putative peptide ABC transporter permease protein [Gordonia effusa NBRC 100432]
MSTADVDAPPEVIHPANRWTRLTAAGRRLDLTTVPVMASVAFLGFILLCAVFPHLLTSHQPVAPDMSATLLGPEAGHIFGTDELGQDVYARVVFAVRPAVLVGVGSTAIAVVCGAILGMVSALTKPLIDTITMRLLDVFVALPSLLLALLIIAVFGTGTGQIIVAVGVAFIPPYARIVRGETVSVRDSLHIESAVGLGISRSRIVLVHILPNAVRPILVLATIGFGTSLLSASILSFLGLGVQPPAPDWGTMLSGARDYPDQWWLVLFPGLALTFTVVAVNIVGRTLRERNDKERR